MKKLFFYMSVLIIPMFFISCTSMTNLFDNYAGDNYKGKKVKKVAVLVKSYTDKNTMLLEKMIVYRLKDCGIDAYPAHEILSADLLKPPRDLEQYEWRVAQLQFQLDKSGIDALLFSFMAGEIESIKMGCPNINNLLFNNFLYSGAQHTEKSSAEAEYIRKVYFITNLCDVISGDMIWSAKSETLNPYSTSDLVKSYVNAVLDDLQDEGIVK